jgi:tripartite-type tricarboxylate transporter receptor subunit TctC
MNRRSWIAVGAAMAALTFSAPAWAQATSYPGKFVKIIIPYPPGGITDIAGRALAQKLTELLGQSFIIENRAGGGGTIGAGIAAKAPADGYTLFLGGSTSHGTIPNTYANLPYDAQKDFAPVALVASTPMLVLVNPALPAKSMGELISYLKANPGKTAYASTGTGGVIHLTVELFKAMSGTDMRHVPYKGSVPALTDLIGGHVDLMFDNMASALPQVKAGKLKALAVTSAKRSSQAPDLPSVAESVAGFDSATWVAIYTPAGTPPEIIARLNAGINQALKSAEVLSRFDSAGLEPGGGTAAELGKLTREEMAKWAGVVKRLGLVPE